MAVRRSPTLIPRTSSTPTPWARAFSPTPCCSPYDEGGPRPAPGVRMLFQLEGVTKTYGAVTALNNLSVAVPAGAIGLLGPNGSGKTTLIRTVLGLITINHGSGQILDKDFRR